ncbi:anthocyanidin 3-O-glucosyltransferase 5-like [Rosa rugosa]|uniref:anthocyanidin 3-O-glucosyltransferase 5-like n=1 Tax=Rosa rugosa TaxID=74645 RepID=UPI002B40641B|nr:anthocyanidin 3-O-glucosyltransferase 5-like [Rosa rugosa]
MGHLIPFLELANCLIAHHNFHATVVVISSNTSPKQSQVIQSAMTPKLFDIIEIPPLDTFGQVNAAGSVFTQLPAIMLDARSSLRSAISAMDFKPAAMIVDLFCTAVLPVVDEFHMLKYVRVSYKEVEGEYLDKKEPLKIPGCKPVRPEDVKPMMNRKDPKYESFIRIGVEIAEMSDGILVNTWEDLESMSLRPMKEDPKWKQILKVPVHTFGPMIRQAGSSTPRSEVLGWLDMQPNASVIYISFGSGGVLLADQITEMAWGIELSAQRFIWVVHPPSKDGDKGNDISDYLPEGFMARTRDKGLVVTTWAPQVEILAHSSVGWFLSHCGWNSSLESILNGVPMIT